MPDTAVNTQLPPRTTTSTRWPRKWSTLGGRCTSSSTTVIPTNESEANENSTKTNGHHRHSTSLFRKSSTISRTNGTPATSDEPSSPSLKKSRSLMNVLRSKLNSPAVLRRFRSKSRESTKQTVTEINGHTTNDQQEVKQSNNEQTAATRKSRKRDPSPMRRLANRISQLTRHQTSASTDRQKTSPSKSFTNDSQVDDNRKSFSPTRNQDEVDHLNACYDEILAKYYTSSNKSNKDVPQDRSLSTISMNGSLRSNDFLNNSQRIQLPLPPDDPVLQARKQSNIKLNCILSGYSLTTSFANHEKSYGQNDLFKFNHYYDVGKRKYDWNFTNHNNRLFSDIKTRPFSKSIDSFRRTNVNENEVPITLEKINIVDNEPLVDQDVPRISSNDNELFIREDNDIHVTPPTVAPVHINHLDENKTQTVDEHDEEFERNFLRAVDRALGVVNKEQNNSTEIINDKPIETDQSNLNLIQMTEQALLTFNNSPLFSNDEQPNDQTVNEVQSVDRVDEPLKSTVQNDSALAEPTEQHFTSTIQDEAASVDRVDEPLTSTLQNETALADRADEPLTSTIQDEAASVDRVDEPLTSTLQTETALADRVDEPLTSTVQNETISAEPTDEPLNSAVQNEITSAEPIDESLSSTVQNETTSVDRTDETTSADHVEEHLDSSIQNETALSESTNEPLNLIVQNETVSVDRTDEPLSSAVQNETVSEDRIDEPLNVMTENVIREEEKEVIDEEIWSIIDNLIKQVEESKNGRTFLANLDDEEKIIKSKSEAYNKLLQTDDTRLTEDVRTDINAVIGEVNLLLRGKLKQFRGLCEANVTKSTNGEPIPLDTDLEGFWDITYPLIDKVKEKFAKLDARKTKQWAPIEEYDPNDVNNRPRVIDDRLKQLQPQQNKSSKHPTTKPVNDDLKKLIQERRKAAANTTNQNHDIEIFVAPK